MIGVGILIIIFIIVISCICLIKKKKNKKKRNLDIPPKDNNTLLNKKSINESCTDNVQRQFERFERDDDTTNLQLLEEHLNRGMDEIERINGTHFNKDSLCKNSFEGVNEEPIPIIECQKIKDDSMVFEFININNDNPSTPYTDNQEGYESSSLTGEYEYAVAKFGFEGTTGDEIHINEGDYLKVEKIYDDGWTSGYNMTNNTYGIFPTLCCTHEDGTPLVRNKRSFSSPQHSVISGDNRDKRSSMLQTEVDRRRLVRESILSFNDSEVNIFGVSKFGAPRNSFINISEANSSSVRYSRAQSNGSSVNSLANEANNSLGV